MKLSVRIPDALAAEIEAHPGTTSDIVRAALDDYFEREAEMDRRVKKIEDFLQTHTGTSGVSWPE